MYVMVLHKTFQALYFPFKNVQNSFKQLLYKINAQELCKAVAC